MSDVKKTEEKKEEPKIETAAKVDELPPLPDIAPPTFPADEPKELEIPESEKTALLKLMDKHSEDKTAKIIAATIEALLPTLIALTKPQPAPAKNFIRARRENNRCLECQQLEMACGGKHVKMICYPTRFVDVGDYFRGCGLNGVWYLSNNENHIITIPAEAEADFSKMIRLFENREISAGKQRKGGHDFGTIGKDAKASMPNPAKMGWS